MSKLLYSNADETGFYQGERPRNYEQKCPLVLVLDVSSSMEGEAIQELNRGLKIFQTSVQNDIVASSRLETAIITFGSSVQIIRDFSLFEGTGIQALYADGATPMAEGLSEAMLRIEARKQWYRDQGLQYYRPYIVLMTDGQPTSSEEDIERVKKAIYDGVDGKKFSFWAFGVEGANMNFLERLSHPSFPPQKLKGFNFQQFFKWLSASMAAITKSRPDERVDISPDPGDNPFQITV